VVVVVVMLVVVGLVRFSCLFGCLGVFCFVFVAFFVGFVLFCPFFLFGFHYPLSFETHPFFVSVFSSAGSIRPSLSKLSRLHPLCAPSLRRHYAPRYLLIGSFLPRVNPN
jgi:hypothetical protein